MNQRELKLGMIGFSSGNGHPYSWSAIFNGYNKSLMEECGFPVIPRYLEKRSWPQDQIANSRVTHIWTQDLELSHKIASTTNIPNVVNAPEKMIGEIDAVLIARDDAENHLANAKPFLEAGLPVYIDKPIASNQHDLNALYDSQVRSGQIFTCSAMRFCQDLRLTEADRTALGEVVEVYAFTPNRWDRYAIHAIEPMLMNLRPTTKILYSQRLDGKHGGAGLILEWENGPRAKIFSTGSGTVAPISLIFIGTHGFKSLSHVNTFDAFRGALSHFVSIVRKEVESDSLEYIENIVKIIERGQKEGMR